MGLADRDYARPGPRGGGYGVGGGWGGLRGRVPFMSFNTWLIVINIAVFAANNVLLSRVYLPITAGTGYYSHVAVGGGVLEPVTDEARARGVVDRSIQPADPEHPGLFTYHPVLDPQRTRRDFAGNLLFDRRAGRFVGEIGRERIMHRPVLDALGHFSTGKAFADLQIWRFLTFQFLHASTMHLLLNMLGLWFFGAMVEERLGFKRYAAFYLMCGAAGAGLYLLLNLLGYGFGVPLPGVLFSEPYTPLVGASAGVFGVLLAAAALYPREMVGVMFIIPMRLRTAVYLFTAFAAYNLLRDGPNAGGDAAHIGGAIAGAYLIRHGHLLDDVVEFFRFSRRSKSARSARRAGGASGWSIRRPEADQGAVDRILEKVHRSGIDSLTDRERDILRRASGRT